MWVRGVATSINRFPKDAEIREQREQLVREQHEVSLADVLAPALPDIPDQDALAHKPKSYPMPATIVEMLHDLPDDRMPGRDMLSDRIAASIKTDWTP